MNCQSGLSLIHFVRYQLTIHNINIKTVMLILKLYIVKVIRTEGYEILYIILYAIYKYC